MKDFSGKYEQLYEDTLYRYQQNGFLIGDYVKFKKDSQKEKMFEHLSDALKSLVITAVKDDSMFRVSFIKSPHSEAGSLMGAPNVPGCLWADIYFEHAPGMWSSPMTVPLALLDKLSPETDAEGFVKYNRNLIRPNVKEPKDDPVRDKQTNSKDKEHNISDKNTKLPNTKEPKDGREQTKLKKESTDMNIFEGMDDNALIFENYIKGKTKTVGLSEKYSNQDILVETNKVKQMLPEIQKLAPKEYKAKLNEMTELQKEIVINEVANLSDAAKVPNIQLPKLTFKKV